MVIILDGNNNFYRPAGFREVEEGEYYLSATGKVKTYRGGALKDNKVRTVLAKIPMRNAYENACRLNIEDELKEVR